MSAAPADRALSLVYIIGTYPVLTTTFIDREIDALRRGGLEVQVVSIRRPAGPLAPAQAALSRDVVYLLPVSIVAFIAAHLRFALLRPIAYFGTLLFLLTRAHPGLASRGMTLIHFAEGVYAAYLLRRHRCQHLHAHFIDRAATVALVAGRLLGVPYSATAHANDIYVRPVLVREKLSQAKFVATCTAYNQAYLARQGDFGGKLSCVYHGLDVRRYQPAGEPPRGKPVVVAVGQLKEKKGFSFLLDACRTLKDRGYEFECQIVGEGPLRPQLEAQRRRLGLEEWVTFCGALPHEKVIETYQRAAIFALPCVVGSDGDRDGIPNVILEAMAMQLPVVSTRHSGIPEAVVDGVTGVLVASADAAALAEALAALLDDPARRLRLGRNGREMVTERFDALRNAQQLLQMFTA